MTAKYAYIHDTATTARCPYPTASMCTWLQVSTSGYYDWRQREPSARAQRRQELTALVRWSFDRSQQRYGYRRVHADLVRRAQPKG